MKVYGGQRGFALPTVVIASLVLMMVLVAVLSTTTSTRTAMEEQYFTQLSRETAEAGYAKAQACIMQNGSATWGASKPLKPETDCSGNTAYTCPNAACYVANGSNARTYFTIYATSSDANAQVAYTVQSTLEFTKTTGGAIWKTVTNNTKYLSNYRNQPKVSSGSAGGGIQSNMALVGTTDNQVYAFGYNVSGQYNDSSTPTAVTVPTRLALPTGVSYVKKFMTSGHGAISICIIGSDDNAYCRGYNSAAATGIPGLWAQVKLSVGLKVYDVVFTGWNTDTMCVQAGLNALQAQAYCIGSNSNGQFGVGTTTGLAISSTASAFQLPGGLYAQKIYAQDNFTCVKASDNNLYCAGQSDYGQIASTVSTNVMVPVKYNLPAMGSVARTPKDVLMEYDGGSDKIFVLANDGTIWVSGLNAAYGSSALGSSPPSTNTSAPSLWGYSPNTVGVYGTGDQVWINVSGVYVCIDNANGSSADGNKIQAYGCSGSGNSNPNQLWFFTDDTQAIWNPATGKCLAVANNTTYDGTAIQLYTCDGSSAQRWAINGDGTIRNISANKCIDLTAGNTANGTQIQLWNCGAGNGNQQWRPNGRARPWKGIIATNNSFCGLRLDEWSGLWCAGSNNGGQLLNRGDNISGGGAFGQPCETAISAYMGNFGPYTNKVDYTKLSPDWQYQYNSLQIIAQDGQVYGSGYNLYGKLGSGSLGDSANGYRQCYAQKFQLPSGVTALDMSTRDEHSTYVLGSDGNVYAAGLNNTGQLGDGTTTNRSTPIVVQVPKIGYSY